MKLKVFNFYKNVLANLFKSISSRFIKASSLFTKLIFKGITTVSKLKKPIFLLKRKMRDFMNKIYVAIRRSALFIKISFEYILNKISVFVVLISPLGYIGLFIILILLYSIFYYFLPPSSLYHSTSQFEYEYLTPDANNVLFSIRKRIIQNFTDHYGSTTALINGWELDINELNVFSLDVKNFPENAGFGLRLPVTYVYHDKHYVYSEIKSRVTIPANQYLRIDDIYYFFVETKDSNLSVVAMGIPQLPSSKDLFYSDDKVGFTKDSRVLSLPTGLWKQILDFGQVYRGFPEKGTGQYIRMLYLSAGIATSTAFGDIVPITTLSRTLVFSEAIFSIIIIGLFLNSVGNKVAKSVISSSGQRLEEQ